MSHVGSEMCPVLTCCGDPRNNRRGLDLETECLAAVALMGRALMASVSNSVEGLVGRSKDDILPSPKKEKDSETGSPYNPYHLNSIEQHI